MGRGDNRTRLRELLLGFFGDFDLGFAHVFDFNDGGAVDVYVVVVKGHLAFDVVLVLRQGAVFDPELHGAFWVSDFGSVAAGATRAREQRFDSFGAQFTRICLAVLFQTSGLGGKVLRFVGRS